MRRRYPKIAYFFPAFRRMTTPATSTSPPAIGGIGRIYVVPNISITGELDFLKVPEAIDERYQAHYWDFDLYGTVNFNDYVGAQIGYRSLDLGYVFEDDHGDFKARGIYFGGVVRY